jgi:hypothetical protein
MAFHDFIRNREVQQPAGEQHTQQQREISRDDSATASREQAAAKPVEYVRPDQHARLAEAQALYSKGTQELPSTTPPPTPTPEGAANPQPMKQPMMGQETVAPDMSPTSAQASARAQDVEGPSAPAPTSAKSQHQASARPVPSLGR